LFIEKGYILFPKEESKGRRESRKIILNERTKEIIVNNLGGRKEGYVFLNSRKQPWTKYAICARMQDLSKRIGTRMFMYAARHGYGTRKLKAGHGHLAIAATMGHKDGSMLAKIYSHIDEDDEHLRTVLVD
jgi:integrase